MFLMRHCTSPESSSDLRHHGELYICVCVCVSVCVYVGCGYYVYGMHVYVGHGYVRCVWGGLCDLRCVYVQVGY